MKQFPLLRRLGHHLRRPHLRNPHASPHPRHTSNSTSTSTHKSRIDRINARLPRFLHPYTTPLASAPASIVTAFLVLHELTAVVPLFALTTFFHYTNYLPSSVVDGEWVASGIEKFGRYFRRKGWIADSTEERELEIAAADHAREGDGRDGGNRVGDEGEGKGKGVRIVVEVATAYAITKALLPVRLVGSVWATPWFARVVVVPVVGFGRRVFGRG
ncbi:uncharacterized protein BDZ99DRAFT_455988 [Mytilinidion resinicola]|uniref:Uncharacterized protein n=1 Tax=Mytilinidion resinicola TaxID=574789 RepID=A0A6A6XYN4_9PEZI|nr:uncharacterized protein BDZ99DRAFT_455988 [Mytilinidion resinicola]KAF2801530.1 hypothetical protein BDZ99DRAFT_455988 [Mytilinidion resinicola]